MSLPEPVLVERRGHVLIITINRPEAMNAVNSDVSMGLGAALEAADADPDVRAVILTGAGERAFCAGADLKAVARGESLYAPGHEEWGFAGYTRHPISKPTIAAVNGFALGGGTELTLASDLAVASSSATFGLPEVARGLFAAAGGVFRLPEQIPRKIALEMILTGEPLDAGRAAGLGLVNQVVAPERLLEAALDLAGRVARNAPLAVQASKRVAQGITAGGVAAEETAWELNDREIRMIRASADVREGTAAFAEKRSPKWQNR